MQYLADVFCLRPLVSSGSYWLVGLFLAASLALLAEPIVPQLFGHDKGMDYATWFSAGRRMLQGGPTYPTAEGRLGFLYTPFAALLMAIPSYFGKTALVVTLACTTLAGWWIAICLSNRLAGNEDKMELWSVALPVAVTLPFVYDQFHLGQPNVLLLALMLYGFLLLRADRGWLAGLPFATAAAIKAFPVMIFPYLLWRRQWRTAASMAAFMMLFLVAMPGTIRGYQRNLNELGFWVHEMLLSGGDREFAQREDTFSWKNQSLYAVEHRLLRPVDAESITDRKSPPLYVNFLNLDYATVNKAYWATAVVIGLAFVAALPGFYRRSPRSDDAEWGILLVLIVIATPLVRSYYYVWLLFPYTVLAHRLASEPGGKLARLTVAAIGFSIVLLISGINVIQPRYPQAAGNFLWAAIVVALALAVHMRHDALPAQPAQSKIE
jgi:hypothetical protein